jgi:hypothetical protein
MVFEDGRVSCYLDERMSPLTHRTPVFDHALSCGSVSGHRRADHSRADHSVRRKARRSRMGSAQGSNDMTYVEAIRESGLARLHFVAR